jgi:putative membrane protein
MPMIEELLHNLGAAAVYAALGIILFVLAFGIINRLTPGTLWKELIEEHNTALAIVVGAMAIGISIIIAAAIW